jgi:hypothetical protein
VLNGQGDGNTEQILNGLLWAVQEGANVVSMSIGFNFPGYVNFLVSQGMKVDPATLQTLSAYRENVRLFDALAGPRARAELDVHECDSGRRRRERAARL